MPSQLIYTSWPRGIAPGQSGFCTVARCSEMRDALVQRLEQLSSYHHLAFGANAPSANPLICAYRILDIRGTKYHALTRIQDAGLDFTGRTNHLVHHLVFEAFEVAAMPSPAAIFRFWNGWRTAWKEEPRLLGDNDKGNLNQLSAPRLPAAGWQQFTGDAGRAAALLESECLNGCFLLGQPGGELQLLELFSESLQLLDPEGRSPIKTWPYPFTTFLQAEDNPADFRWRGCWAGSPGHQAATRNGAVVLDPRQLRIPENEAARFARQGKPLPAIPKVSLKVVSEPRGPQSAPGKPPLTIKKGPEPVRSLKEEPDWESAFKSSAPEEKSELWTWVVILALLGMLVGGFFLYRSRQPKPDVPAPETPAVTNRPAVTNPTPGVTPPLPETPNPFAKPPETKPPETVTPSTSSAAVDLEQLQDRLDGIPTYILISGSKEIDLPAIPDLEEMLKLIAGSFVNVDQEAELVLQMNKNNIFKAASGVSAAFSCDKERKLLLCAGGPLQFQIDFSAWYAWYNLPPNTRNSDPKKPPIILKNVVLSTIKSASMLFKPTTNNTNEFAPFRLVVVDSGPQSEPVELSKTLLIIDQVNFEKSLSSELAERVKKMIPLDHLYSKCEFQLRVFTDEGAGFQPLFDQLDVRDRPRNGENELNFQAIRQRLSATNVWCQAELEKIKSKFNISNLSPEIASLKKEITSIQEIITRLAKQIPQLNETINSLEKQIATLDKEIEPINFAIRKLIEDIDELNKKIEVDNDSEKPHANKALRKRIVDYEAQKLAKLNEKKGPQNHRNQAQEKLDANHKERDLAFKEHGTKSEKLSHLNEEIYLKIRLAKLMKQMDELPDIFSLSTTKVGLVIVDTKSPKQAIELIRFTHSPK